MRGSLSELALKLVGVNIQIELISSIHLDGHGVIKKTLIFRVIPEGMLIGWVVPEWTLIWWAVPEGTLIQWAVPEETFIQWAVPEGVLTGWTVPDGMFIGWAVPDVTLYLQFCVGFRFRSVTMGWVTRHSGHRVTSVHSYCCYYGN